MGRTALLALVLTGCGAAAGGICRTEYACVDFDDSVGNNDAREACTFITDDVSNGANGVTTTYNALSKECPEGFYILDCAFGESLYQTSGVIRYDERNFTYEEADASCRSLGGTPGPAQE